MTDPWRSLLYVPAHVERFVDGAHRFGAHAFILDLEDSVPDDLKTAARAALPRSVETLAASGDVLVRVNRPWRLAWRDLEAAVGAGARGVVLPKTDTPAQVAVVGEFLTELEARRPRAPMAVLVCIETPSGLNAVREIAFASPRLTGIIVGNQDLATQLGIPPDGEHMVHAYAPAMVAARAAGILPFGTVGSSAAYADVEAFRRVVDLARSWGSEGITCIHPSQVAIVNQGFRPSQDALRSATRIVEAFEAGDGSPVSVDGEMVDRPVYQRAKRIVDDAGRR